LYIIEQDRILSYSGVINITKNSVLFERIDNVNIKEGMLNKIFKTATIQVEAMGSIKPVLQVENIPNYKEIFIMLQEGYKNKA
jgi:uncharacterized membrane protein YdbT with pleckstrin-like domain